MSTNKNILIVDWGRYDSTEYDCYKRTVQRIFKHRIVRNSQEKIQLIDEICLQLPIILMPFADKSRIYYRTICNVINQLLYLTESDKGFLYYKTRKCHNTKFKQDNQPNTLTTYSFYFKDSRDKR